MIAIATTPALDLAALRSALAGGRSVAELMATLLPALDARAADAIWIARVPEAALRARAAALDALPAAARGPLHGIPFAVKDNIDVAGLPTTAACPAFAYTPKTSAPAVQRLLDAGAVLLGKTNMDQFATGLSGTRTPYGAPANAFDPAHISGGSSSGSALAVAHGLVSFALGTDTAGSGRVPAAFGNLVGLKPSRGLVSTRGLVPACRSLDCVSVFALTCRDAQTVLDTIAGFDAEDAFSRPAGTPAALLGDRFHFGVPAPAQRFFDGDEAAAAAFANAIAALEALGGAAVVIDYAPFREAAQLLYEGPWLAERQLAIGAFLAMQADALVPVVRDTILGGASYTAADAFAAAYRLRALHQQLRPLWAQLALVVTPTAPRLYTRAAVVADPVRLNAHLGHYTNHVNLLDLCAVAVPAGMLPGGLPFGVTLQAPAGSDARLLAIADRLQRATNTYLGATGGALADTPAVAEIPTPASIQTPIIQTPTPLPTAAAAPAALAIAVCGGHMAGLPLNHELTARGASLLARTRTAPSYRLYALAGFSPPRPGLVRDPSGGSIAVEVWSLPLAEVGIFLAGVPAPLAIGSLELADGTWVKGFVCEGHAIAGALDITALGGWRAWLARP